MKKIALVFAVIISVGLISGSSKAQGVRMGLTASPSIAWFKPETADYESEGVRLGFSYGVVAEFFLAEHYSFATGMNITYLGGKLSFPTEEEFGGTTYNQKERVYKLQNLEIPLTLKMKTREIGYNTYFGVFGFGNSINLKATGEDIYHDSTRPDMDIKSDIPFFRVSMILGMGVEYSLGGNTALVGGVTFNNGFTNILKGENPLSGRKQNARANYIELSLGVLF